MVATDLISNDEIETYLYKVCDTGLETIHQSVS
jgi:hypothetical protein